MNVISCVYSDVFYFSALLFLFMWFRGIYLHTVVSCNLLSLSRHWVQTLHETGYEEAVGGVFAWQTSNE